MTTTVKDIIQQLQYGELNQDALFGDRGLQARDEPKLVQAINRALRQIYSQLPVSEKQFTLVTQDGLTTYPLLQEFAESSVDTPTTGLYIEDSAAEPFLNDIMKIVKVTDSETGQSYSTTARGSELTPGIRLLRYDTIQTCMMDPGTRLKITYRATHSKILTTGDYKSTEINLAPGLIPAFVACVAWQVTCGYQGDAQKAFSNEMLSKYNFLLQEADNRGMTPQIVPVSDDPIRIGGWV